MGRGLRDCTCPFDVWGVHCNAAVKEGAAGASVFPAVEDYPYDDLDPGSTISNWPTIGDPGPLFVTYAAKVPSSYPYPSCTSFPPHSSADERVPERERFAVAICTAFEEKEPDPGIGITHTRRDVNIHYCYGSRSIYVDGEQTHVMYMISGERNTATVHHINGVEDSDNDSMLGRTDYVLVDIQKQEAVATYHTGTLSPLEFGDMTYMEGAYYGQYATSGGALGQTQGYAYPPWNGATTGNGIPYYETAVQAKSVGIKFLNISGYMPGVSTWAITRIELSADFSSDRNRVWTTDPDVITTPEGDAKFAPMLPSAKVFILSEPPEPDYGDFSDTESRQPDESWWIAKNGNSIVTGRLLNKDLLPDSGDETAGSWNGYMQAAEVANVLETYEEDREIHCRCYQHKDGKDLAIITLGGFDVETDTPFADFGGSSGVPDLQSGLDGDAQFDNPLEDTGDQATAQAGTAYYTDAPDYVNFDPDKCAAEFNVGPALAWHAQLTRKAIVKNANSTITFDARLFNPAASVDTPTIPRGNFPATDGAGNYDTLAFYVNGVLKWMTDNTDEAATAATFYEFRPVTVTGIPAGPVTYRWILTRATATNYMKAWIANVSFPEEVISEELTGYKTFYYNGAAMLEMPKVEWPDRSSGTSLIAGTATPDYITSDSEGRILLGNPHYLMRIMPDGTLDGTFGLKGVLKWTASPAKNPLHEIKDPAKKKELQLLIDSGAIDLVSDPPWGAFQIMCLMNGNIQVRGVNGSYTDATTNGVDRVHFPNEQFVYALKPAPGFWPHRLHAFTIKQNGGIRSPHLEAAFRPDFAVSAYPIAAPFDSPPNWTGLEYDGPDWVTAATSEWFGVTPMAGGVMRWRSHTLAGATDEDLIMKPRWWYASLIYSRQYCTALSRAAQYLWWHSQLRDPTEEDSPELQAELPWPSVRWALYQAYHDPITSSFMSFLATQIFFDPDDEPTHFYYLADQNREANGRLTDFDAVDCGCDCGCDDNVVTPMDGGPDKADGTVTKIYTYTDDMDDFGVTMASGHLDAIQDAGHLVLYDTASLDTTYNYLNVCADLNWELPDTASKIKKIELTSIRVKVALCDEIASHGLQIHLTDADSGLPALQNSDGTTLVAEASLDNSVGDWIEIDFVDKKFPVLTQFQGLDTTFRIKLKLLEYIDMPEEGSDDDPPVTDVEVWIDDLTWKAEYENYS